MLLGPNDDNLQRRYSTTGIIIANIYRLCRKVLALTSCEEAHERYLSSTQSNAALH